MITRVKLVTVYVADQAAARRFYVEALGFEVRREMPMGPGATWLEVAPPGGQTVVVLYPRALMAGWETMKPSIVFACESVEATHAALERGGVAFTQAPTRMAWGTSA
jgi:lactoylglutathione lyase